MKQRLIITCVVIGLLVNSPGLFAQRRSRGMGRTEQLAALEAIQQQIDALMAGLQHPPSQTDFRQMPDAQREQFRQQFMRLRAEREAALKEIERQTLKLKGTRELRTQHEEMIRKLTALKGLADTGESQALAECLAVMIQDQQAAFDARMRGLQGDTEVVKPATLSTEKRNGFRPGVLWPDNHGIHINAHGGGMLYHQGRYYLLTSGCTGWAPNAARSAVADSIWGPWRALDNPCIGINPQTIMGPELTFGGQSTCILPVAGRANAFIAMFDLWRPGNPIDGRYLWLPVSFTDNGFQVRWHTTWDLSHFEKSREQSPVTQIVGPSNRNESKEVNHETKHRTLTVTWTGPVPVGPDGCRL